MAKGHGQRALRLGGDCNHRAEGLLLRILAEHKGIQTAVPMEDLARTAGLSTRELQVQIKHLIEHHGQLIGSSTGKPNGYYLATAADLHKAKRQLWNRAMSNLVRISKLDQISIEAIFGQVPMQFEEFIKGETHAKDTALTR